MRGMVTGSILRWITDQGRLVDRSEIVDQFRDMRPAHVDQILSRLVDGGDLVRLHRGVYGVAIPADRFPEHDKMFPFSKFEMVEDFCLFLIAKGVVVADIDQVRRWIRSWRGVDELAYQAEVATLRSQYRSLWGQYLLPPAPGPKVRVLELEEVPPEQPAQPVPAGDPLKALLNKIKETS